MAKDPNIDIPKIDDTVNTPSDGRAGVFVKDTATRPDGSLHIIDDQGAERELVDKDYVDSLPSGGDVTGPVSSDDNAVARFDGATGKVVQNSGVTIDDSGNIATAGTVDGRDLSVDGAKLDGIEPLADVTDETNVVGALDGATLPAATVAGTDKVVIQDTDDSDKLKTVTAQSIADLGAGGGGDVTGPASSTDNALARFDAATGKVIQNSDATLDDDGNLVVVGDATIKQLPFYNTIAGVLSTGLISGGALTPNVDTTKFDISAGRGLIIDVLSDPANPIITQVQWAAKTGLTPTYIATENISFIAIDVSGTVIQSASTYTTEQARDLIVLGTILHTNNTNVTGGTNRSRPVQSSYEVGDLAVAIGAINVYGNNFSEASTDLTIQKQSGQSFLTSSNKNNNAKDPNFVTDSAQNPISFLYAYNDGSGGVIVSPDTNIDPDQYDDGSGTLASVANNKWTKQWLYWFPASGLAVVRYGTEVFDTLADAEGTFARVPEQIGEGFGPEFIRTVLFVKKGAADLSNTANAVFAATGKFGLGSSVGVGGDGGTFQDLQETYNNSATPEILTDVSRGALTVRRGSAAESDNVLEAQNNAGSNVFAVTGEGDLSLDGTVDGRDVAADGTKLDTVETGADVTDETNVTDALNGATLPTATVAGTDKVLIQDASDSDNLKTVTAQAIADLGGGGGGDLQSAFNASTSPEITTDATRGALSLRRGSAADTDNVLEVQDGAGSGVFAVKGTGGLSTGNSLTGGIGALAVGTGSMSGSYASGDGAIAFGYNTGFGNINASGYGAIAGGYHTTFATINAQGNGSVAIGATYSVFSLLAQGEGSVCFGRASSGDIQATAESSMQLGSGSNTQANSISVAGGIRINGAAAPSVKRNGDLWVESSKIYGRSNGVDVELAAGGGGGTPAGANHQVQFNDSGAFGASSNFLFNDNYGVFTAGFNSGGTIYSGANGSWVGGYAASGGDIVSSYPGGFARGFATSDGVISTGATGATAFGAVENYGYMTAYNQGAFACGFVGSYSYLRADGKGSQAFGSLYNGHIYAQNDGSIAFGSAYSGDIYSRGKGSLAGGHIGSSGKIEANNHGSFAFGDATAGDIVASATNAMQFGVGTNTESNSISVAGGVRINGAAAPAALRNGDIWVASGYTYIRSNGVSVKIT